jgi:hypothetical protein
MIEVCSHSSSSFSSFLLLSKELKRYVIYKKGPYVRFVMVIGEGKM